MVRLWLCGDVMIGRGIDQVMRQSVDPRLYEPFVGDAREYVRLAVDANGPIPRPVAPDYVWGAALDDLERFAPDIRLVNLETTLTMSDAPWPAKEVLYRAHPDNVAVLNAARIDCCSLANNHALDWGRPGLLETLDTARAGGIASVGAGSNLAEAEAPRIFDVPGGRVIVLGLASTSSGVPLEWAATPDTPGIRLIDGWAVEVAGEVAQQLQSIRQPGDVLVTSIHWGSNWGHQITSGQRALAHRLIEVGGVDVVHGHSSHHARALELFRGRLILYGCGDFITDYEGIAGHEDFRGDLVAAYLVDIDPRDPDVDVQINPYRLRRFRLERPSAAESDWVAGTLDRESGRLGTRVDGASDGTLHLGPVSRS